MFPLKSLDVADRARSQGHSFLIGAGCNVRCSKLDVSCMIPLWSPLLKPYLGKKWRGLIKILCDPPNNIMTNDVWGHATKGMFHLYNNVLRKSRKDLAVKIQLHVG